MDSLSINVVFCISTSIYFDQGGPSVIINSFLIVIIVVIIITIIMVNFILFEHFLSAWLASPLRGLIVKRFSIIIMIMIMIMTNIIIIIIIIIIIYYNDNYSF